MNSDTNSSKTTSAGPTNHMGIKKTMLLACESVYWADINAGIEKHMKNCTTCLEFQQTQPK